MQFWYIANISTYLRFYKCDAVSVAIVINILQFLEYCHALRTIVGIWRESLLLSNLCHENLQSQIIYLKNIEAILNNGILHIDIIEINDLLDTREKSTKYKTNTRNEVWVVLRQWSSTIYTWDIWTMSDIRASISLME